MLAFNILNLPSDEWPIVLSYTFFKTNKNI